MESWEYDNIISELDVQNSNLQEAIKMYREDVSKMEKKIDILEVENSKLKKRVNDLETENLELKVYINETERILNKTKGLKDFYSRRYEVMFEDEKVRNKWN